MLLGDLREVVTMAAAGDLQQARMKLFHPLGFMLASPVASVDEAVARFATELAAEQAAPSDDEALKSAYRTARSRRRASLALIEDKYDGIRCQLHCGDAANPERVALFSRRREDLTESFPELASGLRCDSDAHHSRRRDSRVGPSSASRQAILRTAAENRPQACHPRYPDGQPSRLHGIRSSLCRRRTAAPGAALKAQIDARIPGATVAASDDQRDPATAKFHSRRVCSAAQRMRVPCRA